MDMILKVVVFLFLNGDIILVSGRFCNPTPPLCADDCNGNGYYLNEEQTECIQCPTCPAGQELNKACGNGVNGDAICRPCPDGYFSTSTSRHCSPCTTCINTIEVGPCQITQDRVCGDCLPGFARSSDRFAADPNSCTEQIVIDIPTPAPIERPVPVEPLDGLDACEPQPPRCIDPCYNGNYYVGSDGLCKVCLQCQPGEELNKVCGKGKNGDAYCQPCPKGTFSEDGIGRCTPCRICVNTKATECTAMRDSVCGSCLPGYYQEADGFFPDKEACPNKCTECPTTIPQCEEWCESQEPADEFTMVTTSTAQPTEHHADRDLKDDVIEEDVVSDQAAQMADFQNAAEKEGINDEAGSIQAHHVSYTTIFAVLASLLAVVIIILIIVLVVFRYFWRKPGGSNRSVTAETTLIPEITPSPGSYPRVYNPTTNPILRDEDPLEFIKNLKLSSLFSNLTAERHDGVRPSSASSTDDENKSSADSTPTLDLNRRLAERDLRKMILDMHNDHNDYMHPDPKHQHHHPQSFTGLSSMNSTGAMNRSGLMPGGESPKAELDVPKPPAQEPGPDDRLTHTDHPVRPSSSRKVVEERGPGTAHQHVEDRNEAAGGLRRRSIVNADNDKEQPWPLPKHRLTPDRRHSMPCVLSIRDDINMSRKRSNGNNSQVREPEAALFPTDSPGDDVDTASAINNKKTTIPTPSVGSSPPHPTSLPTATDAGAKIPNSLGILPENDGSGITPEKKSSHIGVGNKSDTRSKSSNMEIKGRSTSSTSSSGGSPLLEQAIIFNINLTANENVGLHVGDVHNRRISPNATSGSEYDDRNNDEDEDDRLLKMTTSEDDTFTESHTRNDEDDEEDDEEDKLLDQEIS